VHATSYGASVLGLSPSGAAVAVLAVGVAVVAAYLVLRAGAAEQRLRLGAAGAGDPSTPADPATLAPQGPQRYRVTVHAHDGSSTQYSVVTSSDSKKAASIAFDDYTRTLEPDVRRSEVHDVQVEHLGPAERTASGAVDFHDGDLFDRSEF
jgi:hypothetical protein